jgi:hypothetical protein
MSKLKDGKVRKTFDIDENVANDLKSFCDKNGIHGNFVVENLIKNYLTEMQKKQNALDIKKE